MYKDKSFKHGTKISAIKTISEESVMIKTKSL